MKSASQVARFVRRRDGPLCPGRVHLQLHEMATFNKWNYS